MEELSGIFRSVADDTGALMQAGRRREAEERVRRFVAGYYNGRCAEVLLRVSLLFFFQSFYICQ